MSIKRVHPGEIIKDSLEASSMKANELSLRTGISERTLSAVINGKGSITFDIAYKLAEYWGDSVEFWCNLQHSYDMYEAEEQGKKDLKSEWALLKPLSNELVGLGYLSPGDSNAEKVKKARSVAGVNSLLFLNREDSLNFFKLGNGTGGNIFAENFWVAWALKDARKIDCEPYDRDKLNDSIPYFRSLMLDGSASVSQKLRERLGECGVRFVELPYLSESNVYGATRWITSSSAMLAISNRSGDAVEFWLTFFHELSHVLLEHKREFVFSTNSVYDRVAEAKADDLIIPKDKWLQFISNKNFDDKSISLFSSSAGVTPDIVKERLNRNHLV